MIIVWSLAVIWDPSHGTRTTTNENRNFDPIVILRSKQGPSTSSISPLVKYGYEKEVMCSGGTKGWDDGIGAE